MKIYTLYIKTEVIRISRWEVLQIIAEDKFEERLSYFQIFIYKIDRYAEF